MLGGESITKQAIACDLCAVCPPLEKGESCATVEIKVVHLSSAREEELVCDARVIRKGARVAILESEIFESERLVAKRSARIPFTAGELSW